MQYSQEHLKTMVYAEFGGQTECIMGNSKIKNNGKERGETAVFAGYDRTCFQSVCVEKRWPPAIERVIGLGEVPF